MNNRATDGVGCLRQLHVGDVGAVERKQEHKSGSRTRDTGHNGQPVDHLLTEIEPSCRRVPVFDEAATLPEPFEIHSRQQIVSEENHHDNQEPCHESEARKIVRVFGNLGDLEKISGPTSGSSTILPKVMFKPVRPRTTKETAVSQ